MRASKNVLMQSREGTFGYKNMLNNNNDQQQHHYNEINEYNSKEQHNNNFQIRRTGTGVTTTFSRPQNSNLYREIASREQPRRSPRNYSQANIKTYPMGMNINYDIDRDNFRNSKDFNTYSEVQSMLKGLFANLNEQNDNQIDNKVQHKNDNYSFDTNVLDQKTDYNSEYAINPIQEAIDNYQPTPFTDIYSGGLNVNDLRQSHNILKHQQPSHIQNISRISLSSLPYNNNNFNHLEGGSYQSQIEDKDATIQLLQDTNTELNNQLALLSQRLDDLMLKVKQKQMQDEKNLQKLSECGHDVQIERLQKQLQQREDDIKKVKDRLEQQSKLKEREIHNTQDKIMQSKKELVAIQKRHTMTESERIVDLEQKIIGIDLKNKDLTKEIKQLKKMQHDHGNELIGLQNTNEYPEKIRSLMEEVRWAKDKQIELTEKVQNEEKQVKRQKEHLLNLEDSKKDLEMKYKRQIMKLGVAEDQLNDHLHYDYKDIDQVQLLNKIIALEEQLQARNKENKLFNMKLKELATQSQKQQQMQINSQIMMKSSPRRQARSATRGYKSSHSTSRNNHNFIQSNNNSVIVQHQKPVNNQNQTIDDTSQALKKKKDLNEQYSFLLGKLDRSRSNIRTNRDNKSSINKNNSKNRLITLNNGNSSNLLLPKLHLKNNIANINSRNLNNNQNNNRNNRSIIGSGLGQYYNSSSVDAPKINIIAASDNNLSYDMSQQQQQPLQQYQQQSPYKSVRSSRQAASIKSLGGSFSQSSRKSLKSLKKVEFADSINERTFDHQLNSSSMLHNTSPNLKSLDALKNHNINSNNNVGMANYGTNRSIRRVRDQDDAVNLPDFKINLDNNTDDILKQLKSNFTTLI